MEYKQDVTHTSKCIEYKLDDSAGYMIAITNMRLRPYLKLCLSTEGLSYGIWYFLRVLWEEDGLSQKELVHRSGLTQPTGVEAVRNMQLRGLIEVKKDPNDGRQTIIFLTQEGKDMKDKILPKLERLNEIFTTGVSKEEFEVMRRVLRKIRLNIDAASPIDILK